MLNVIRFLEKMGSEAQWSDIDPNHMELALAETNIEEPVRLAILSKDIEKLHVLLQQKESVCLIIPGEGDEEEEGEDEPGEKDARRSSSFSLAPQS